MLIPRTQALELLKSHIKNERMIAHSLSSEAVMRALAVRLGENEEKWGLAGLLHDLDVEITAGNPLTHALVAAQMLSELGLDADIVDAVRMHNEMATGMERSTLFQHALAAGETITGLITATAMVYPDRKVASVKSKSITKRMKEKAFAASVNRESILECEKIGLSIDEFAALSLAAMCSIADEIGL
jgi:putative nucleotidyltransferase with HDIG domain